MLLKKETDQSLKLAEFIGSSKNLKMNFKIPIAVCLFSLMANGCSLKHHNAHEKSTNLAQPDLATVGDTLKASFAQTGDDASISQVASNLKAGFA